MKVLITLIIFIVAGCSEKIGYHGKSISEMDIGNIKIGKTSKEEVYNLVGSPSLEFSYKSNEWIYVFHKRQYFLIKDNKELEQRVVIISFDDNEIVKNVKITNADNVRDIKPISYKTKSINAAKSLFRHSTKPKN